MSQDGAIIATSDEQILHAYRWLADREGVFCEPASAASVAGLLAQHGPDGESLRGGRVVCTITGHGLKDPERAIESIAADVVEVDSSYEAASEAIEAAIADPIWAALGGRRAVTNMVDHARAEAAVRELLLALGEDPDREGLRDTPRRVATAFAENFGGREVDIPTLLSVGFEEGHDEMVILRDVPFYSMCEHHLLPFHGVAHIGYVPSGRVVGLSKLARLVDAIARRPQLQERLTAQIADQLMETLSPMGAGVAVEAEHLCMQMRGIKKPGSRMLTSAMRGSFREQQETRAEFLSLVGTQRL